MKLKSVNLCSPGVHPQRQLFISITQQTFFDLFCFVHSQPSHCSQRVEQIFLFGETMAVVCSVPVWPFVETFIKANLICFVNVE